ncbi:MAG: dTDP-4-dehydrorhamnose 3,5-epimerase [Nitrospirales bacterium]|nr:dTDP-4-dehydrorhamnose 3,5-epimerase [Nitrospira sp.]MDR4502123.1 dTDP-4-dehydrorhamnose 3,5-epimerase [Nitrospirales bacterium]
MKILETELPGVLLIEPDVHRDGRGFFLETYHDKKYREAGLCENFVQDNYSRSGHHTLRGLHAQVAYPQGKLIRASQGEVFDVAVDIRRGSPTFAQWIGVILSGDNFKQLYIPPGFAHGFCVLSEMADLEYKCTQVYHPNDEIVISWKDPDINIAWPVTHPLVSEKDDRARSLRVEHERLPIYERTCA